EPKIVGSSIGLHPIATLISIYAGLNFFGIFGMFLLPIALIVLKHLQDNGYISLWNSPSKS
ncbi:MAG: AI-2E family transporter, partial [Clostridia bacterium]|nr:AI-2E family transporter [Clostridia bacterium]